MIKITFCELHTPLFFVGVNFGTKLNAATRRDIVLTYDRAEKDLVVQFKGQVAIIPNSNIASLTLTDPTEIGLPAATPLVPVNQVSHPMRLGLSAQVETPMGHVFKGEGHGQTGKSPGRPRKTVSDTDRAGSSHGEADSAAMSVDASHP